MELPSGTRYNLGKEQMMIHEHDRVVLTDDLPVDGLQAGDVGTIVHAYRRRLAYEVEFLALDGRTVAVATVAAAQVRAVRKGEIAHARQLVRA